MGSQYWTEIDVQVSYWFRLAGCSEEEDWRRCCEDADKRRRWYISYVDGVTNKIFKRAATRTSK